MSGLNFSRRVKKLTVSELILKLQELENTFGDIDCVLSIDTSDAFNETNLLDVVVNRYEAMDTSDGYVYSICLHGELIPQED
jgi:hypothetical protein